MIRNLLTLLLALAVTLPAAAQTSGGALKVPDAAQFVGPPKGTPLTGKELTQRSHEVGGLIRCPVCQGLSVSDSPSEMAINMKAQVHELLARGYTEEQILKYFELSYGQFVLLKPKFEGVSSLVWLLPLAALLFGGIVVVMKMKQLAKAPVTPTAAAAPPDDAYLARVRDLVSGGK
ncbi:MAG: cytochrome c-type biosis protein CcmH [Acidobacteriota bacterium]|jgi:cytochrome c-type biogenesis protein CcmH|nr:cytochrome c-type biosis protein CcmH [Acidobacteriota bacterium]